MQLFITMITEMKKIQVEKTYLKTAKNNIAHTVD